MSNNINLYQDAHHGGWVLEIFAQGRWHFHGVYGSRSAALGAIHH